MSPAHLKKLRAEEEKLAMAELNKLKRGKKKPVVSYDHPDQSYLCMGEREGRLVTMMLSLGMDCPGSQNFPQVRILHLQFLCVRLSVCSSYFRYPSL